MALRESISKCCSPKNSSGRVSSAVLYQASSRGPWPAQPTSIGPVCPTLRWLWCLWLSSERPQRSKASCWLWTTPCWGRRRWGNVFHPLWWHTRGTPWKQRLLWPLESHWGRTACAKRLLSYPTWGWLPNPKLIICDSGVEACGCQLPNDWFSPLRTLWSSWGGLRLLPHKRSELTTDQAECVSPSPGSPPRLQHDPQLWVTSFLTNPDAVQSRQLLICANAENLLRQSEFGLLWFLLCMWPFWLLLVLLCRASLCNCFPKHRLAAVLGRREGKSHGALAVPRKKWQPGADHAVGLSMDSFLETTPGSLPKPCWLQSILYIGHWCCWC